MKRVVVIKMFMPAKNINEMIKSIKESLKQFIEDRRYKCGTENWLLKMVENAKFFGTSEI